MGLFNKKKKCCCCCRGNHTPPVPINCADSVGGIDGTAYNDSLPWRDTCLMFAD